MIKKFDYLYVVGDSFAYNIDVAKDQLFTERVAKHYDLKLHNHGVGGAGNEYIFKKLYRDIKRIVEVDKKNPLVMVVWTDFARKELYNKHKKHPINIAEHELFDKDFVKTYFTDHYNEKYLIDDTLCYINAAQTLLKYYNLSKIEMFSLSYVDKNGDLSIDTTYMLEESLGELFLQDRFSWSNDNIKNGHLNEVGNQKAADLIISLLDKWY